MSDPITPQLSLEERVARLEGKLGWRIKPMYLSAKSFWWSVTCLGLAISFGAFGLGFPNHWYQVILAALLVALGYHQKWFLLPTKSIHWGLAFLNTFALSMLFKILIGGGHRFPFFWVQFPTLATDATQGKDGWLNVAPNLTFSWKPSDLSAWNIDLTIIQTFLLLITLVGALFEFQPFISFTAFLLILVSIPALLGFDWPFVFPTIILVAIGIYLQSAAAQDDA